MELWFWAALGSALLSGFGNFFFKVAAKRNYSSEMFSLYGGLISILLVLPFALIISGLEINHYSALIGVLAGTIAGIGGITKVYALRYIDTTIFFPLYKLVSPSLAIVFGIVFFAESFSGLEWLGLVMGLLVPLMLINRTEEGRQNNLFKGLVVMFIGAIISASAAALNKYSVDIWGSVIWLVLFSSLGVFMGSVLSMIWKSGSKRVIRACLEHTERSAVTLAGVRAVVMCLSLGLAFYAYTVGGQLAVVHTIQSMYILVPIVLAIFFYKEHWNLQKVAAILVSVAALALLG